MAALESTCWTLIERAADADESAREMFVARYYPVVQAYLSARWKDGRSRDEHGDAVQDVFAECLRDGGALEGTRDLHKQSFRKYLFGVVRNVARAHERRWRRTENIVSDGETLPADDESLAIVFDKAWAKAAIKEVQRGELVASLRNKISDHFWLAVTDGKPAKCDKLSREEQRTLAQLRAGHSPLTFDYLHRVATTTKNFTSPMMANTA